MKFIFKTSGFIFKIQTNSIIEFPPLRTISKVLFVYKTLLYDINYIIMLYHEFHFMFLCIFVEAFYGFKMVMFIKLKKKLICFYFHLHCCFKKKKAIIPLKVYFILNKINNHAV